jgi:hypothetical protein
MKNPCLAILFIVLAGMLLACPASLSIGLAADPAASGGTPAAVANKGQESLNVRYARASLALAKMRLEKAMEGNKRIVGILPDAVIEPLRQVVAISEEQLREALDGTSPSLREVELRIAKANLIAAEVDWRRAAAVNKAVPGTISDRDIERLQLAIEVARLRLERAQTLPTKFTTVEVQWHLQELTKDVLELRSSVEQLSVRE